MTTVHHSLQITYELKYNQLKANIDTYCKRLLRLKILQNTKKLMPAASKLGTGNFELDSENLSVSNASDS